MQLKLSFERKILGAGASGEVKVRREERLPRERLSLKEEIGEGAHRESQLQNICTPIPRMIMIMRTSANIC